MSLVLISILVFTLVLLNREMYSYVTCSEWVSRKIVVAYAILTASIILITKSLFNYNENITIIILVILWLLSNFSILFIIMVARRNSSINKIQALTILGLTFMVTTVLYKPLLNAITYL